jgi:hypothetical protein
VLHGWEFAMKDDDLMYVVIGISNSTARARRFIRPTVPCFTYPNNSVPNVGYIFY